MNWDHAVEIIRPHVVKIETPGGHGTGFLSFYNHDKSWCGIATAAHVVGHADEWQEPIRIRHDDSPTPAFLKPEERVILRDYPTDSAIVLFLKGQLNLPESPVALLPVDRPCPIGIDIGWLGFPAIEPNTLCFFAGTVSARQGTRKAYLIDGVAIHGVSGGPVFHCPAPGEVLVIGCVSAYHANRVTGEALPGLLRAQDVSHFHEAAQWIRNIDEANAKKREFEAAQRATAGTAPEMITTNETPSAPAGQDNVPVNAMAPSN
jgi:hypothetical protein